MTTLLLGRASRLSLCAFLAFSLTACDSDSDNGGNAALVGNWVEADDDSEYDDYLLISAAGDDYRVGFAEHDTDNECFWVENGGDRLVPQGGNRYNFVDSDREDPDDAELTITISGNTMTITAEDGDEEATSTWERSSRTDFTPVCDEGDRAPAGSRNALR